jgi:hypothetical protein
MPKEAVQTRRLDVSRDVSSNSSPGSRIRQKGLVGTPARPDGLAGGGVAARGTDA